MVSRRLNSTNKLTQKISPRNSSSDKYFVTHPPTQILSRPRFWLPKSSDIEPTEILPRRFAQSLPRRPNHRSPHFKGPRFSRWCGGELFASRLRQPCGGEGSEGRALAIPRASGAGWAGAWVARPSRERQTATEPPPRRWHGTDLRSTTAARRTSSAQGATIAAETAAPHGCWRHDPRSGARAKPKTERRTGSEIAEIRSDSVSSRQNRWAAMRRRVSG